MIPAIAHHTVVDSDDQGEERVEMSEAQQTNARRKTFSIAARREHEPINATELPAREVPQTMMYIEEADGKGSIGRVARCARTPILLRCACTE